VGFCDGDYILPLEDICMAAQDVSVRAPLCPKNKKKCFTNFTKRW